MGQRAAPHQVLVAAAEGGLVRGGSVADTIARRAVAIAPRVVQTEVMPHFVSGCAVAIAGPVTIVQNKPVNGASHHASVGQIGVSCRDQATGGTAADVTDPNVEVMGGVPCRRTVGSEFHVIRLRVRVKPGT